MITIGLLVLAVLGLVGCGHAQRPSNASTCDYYAMVQFGGNTSETQFRLIESIVGLAFGGSMNLTNAPSDLTGILNPGSFNGEDVDLQPWFNGSKDSSNLNNEPVGIDWLDGGGLDPLYSFLSGETASIEIANTTNQYRLFSHFFIAFGHIFGCSLPQQPSPGDTTTGSLSLAYVHKFMDLTYNDLGHFIDMMTRAALHNGFSNQDAETFNSSLNARYNVRCAPPVTLNPAMGPQLFSLCQDPSCPLAEPSPDCAAYVNLTADGGTGSANTGTVGLPKSSATSTTSSAPSSTTTTTTTTSTTTSPSATASSNSSSLSSGAIGGIAVGGAAALGIFVLAMVLLWRHKRENNRPSAVGTFAHSQMAEPLPKDGHSSYTSNAPTAMEINMRQGSLAAERYSSYYSPGSEGQSPNIGGSLPNPRQSPDPGGYGPRPSPSYTSWREEQQSPHTRVIGSNRAELDAVSRGHNFGT